MPKLGDIYQLARKGTPLIIIVEVEENTRRITTGRVGTKTAYRIGHMDGETEWVGYHSLKPSNWKGNVSKKVYPAFKSDGLDLAKIHNLREG